MLRWTLRQLQSGSSETRIRAAEKLGNSRNEQVVDALVAVLKDENLDVRKAAAEALGKIGNLRAVEPLAATLQDNARDLLVAGLATSRYVGISENITCRCVVCGCLRSVKRQQRHWQKSGALNRLKCCLPHFRAITPTYDWQHWMHWSA